MSVVSRKLNGQNFELYTKGAPEMIASLCKPETVPPDFQEKLMSFTKHGYRVIAMAWKELPPKINYVKVQRIPRFVGLNLFSTGKYTCIYHPFDWKTACDFCTKITGMFAYLNLTGILICE